MLIIILIMHFGATRITLNPRFPWLRWSGFLQALGCGLLGIAAYYLREPLLMGKEGLLWDPLPGLVIGLAWRGFLPGAILAGFAPLAGGLFSGGPQVFALLAEAGLAWVLFQSRAVLGASALTKEFIIVPMAGGVTVVGALIEQILSMNTPFSSGFATLWIGRALGVMALAPLAFSFGKDFFVRLDRRLFVGWVFLTALLIVVARVGAEHGLDPRSGLALGLIPIVILFWQAIRFGVMGTSFACFLVALLAGLGWVDGNAGLLSFPPGVLGLGLTAVLGTAHGMAALRGEWEETRGWTDSAVRTQGLVFWRWQRGRGVEYDRQEAAREIGLLGGSSGWRLEAGWKSSDPLPEPFSVVQPALIGLHDPAGKSRTIELAGTVESHDTEGRPSLVLGTAVEVTVRELAKEQREKLLLREVELRALRTQLHPHVIFNALNRIASLTMSEPEAARDLLVRLSRLLRAALLAGEKKATTLVEELALVRDYLQLEGAGYGDRLRFQIEMGEEKPLVGLPPLSFFSLVEGAVRRGVGMRKQGATLTLSRPKERVVRVEVDPPVPSGEAEFPDWPDPVWMERLSVERPLRAEITTQRNEDGSVRWVELKVVSV